MQHQVFSPLQLTGKQEEYGEKKIVLTLSLSLFLSLGKNVLPPERPIQSFKADPNFFHICATLINNMIPQ